MADIDYRALAEQATAKAQRPGPNLSVHLAEAQMYWAAYNAVVQEAVASELMDLTRTLRSLEDTLIHMPRG